MPINEHGEYTKELADSHGDKITVEADPGSAYVYVAFIEAGAGKAEMELTVEQVARFRKALKRGAQVIA